MYEMGEKLRKLRKEKHLSQAQVAKRLHLSPSAISSYENFSKLPSLEVLIQLAMFYNVTTDYLLGLDNKKFVNVDRLNNNQILIVNNIINEFSSNY